jgi:hypothetical protein
MRLSAVRWQAGTGPLALACQRTLEEVGMDAGKPDRAVSAHLLGKIYLEAQLLDLAELRFNPVNVGFFVLKDGL